MPRLRSLAFSRYVPFELVEFFHVLMRDGPEKGDNAAMNIYVGNLPFSAIGDDLERVFAEYGQVDSAAVIMDRDTGRSRGFGFVEMGNNDEARKAIQELDGYDLDGRRLRVNEAQPRRR